MKSLWNKQPKFDPIKRDLPPLPLSKETKQIIKQMKLANSFPVKFVESSTVLNALMAIKELKFSKTDVIIYDIRDFVKYEDFHFCHSQHYDIGTWTDNYNEDFSRITRFKYVFIVGDDSVYSSSDFDNYIESISKAKLKSNGLYFYNINRKTIDDENLNGLLVLNKEPTKLNYYPSLAVENEKLWLGGIFMANEKVQKDQIDELCISDALYIGDPSNYKQIKNDLKWVSAFYSNQEVTENTSTIWESALKLMKKTYSKKENFWLSVVILII